MVDMLKRMREEYSLTGVKGELESEGAQPEELMRLKEISLKAGVQLAVKIGGCEAITDMRLAGAIGAEQIIAPMIESPYAAKKFIDAARIVFSAEELQETELLINVETIVGARNAQSIVTLPEASALSGLDIGRLDLTGSMGLPAAESNGSRVFEVCRDLCATWIQAFPGKPCILGGLLQQDTIDFLGKMSAHFPVGCESKKVIFAPGAVTGGHLREAYLAAIEFETAWYENRMLRCGRLSDENGGYFKALEGLAVMLRQGR